jgi:hypothetical protein
MMESIMLYEELHQRYGNHIAKRVQQELSVAEFNQIAVPELLSYLELRAEAAHKEYRARLDNPFINEELGDSRSDYMDVLYRRWCEAEDLAYLVTIAEDVSTHTQANAEGSVHIK